MYAVKPTVLRFVRRAVMVYISGRSAEDVSTFHHGSLYRLLPGCLMKDSVARTVRLQCLKPVVIDVWCRASHF
jgi:hypothetical protein